MLDLLTCQWAQSKPGDLDPKQSCTVSYLCVLKIAQISTLRMKTKIQVPICMVSGKPIGPILQVYSSRCTAVFGTVSHVKPVGKLQ